MTQEGIRQQIVQLEDETLLKPFRWNAYQLLQLRGEGERRIKRQGQQLPSRRSSGPSGDSAMPEGNVPSGDDAESLYEELRAWRIAVAKEADLPAFCVFHNSTLKRIAESRPTSLDQFDAIKGIGPRKLERYGSAVLAIVAGRDTGRSQEKA